ncbi:recombinase family protein [Streptomyces actinomycinicus]|uniref:recombinase family protein n=1 Tax=Streptomyces actinomycinicus TaxID=1695166 RepID=UPI00355900CF
MLLGAGRSSRTRVRQERAPPRAEGAPRLPRPGDTLVVPILDRYGRSLQDLINMVAQLRDRRIAFTSLHGTWTPPSPAAGSSSTSSPPSLSASANSASSAPTKAWPPPASAAESAVARVSPPTKTSAPHAILESRRGSCASPHGTAYSTTMGNGGARPVGCLLCGMAYDSV